MRTFSLITLLALSLWPQIGWAEVCAAQVREFDAYATLDITEYLVAGSFRANITIGQSETSGFSVGSQVCIYYAPERRTVVCGPVWSGQGNAILQIEAGKGEQQWYDFVAGVKAVQGANFQDFLRKNLVAIRQSCADTTSALSPLVYQTETYLSARYNADLTSLSPAAAIEHWLNHGIREGRQASKEFQAFQYLRLNADVSRYFGAQNHWAAISHYVNHGRAEGRVTLFALHPKVFQADVYLDPKFNADLRPAGINTVELAKKHWLDFGIYEGRQGSREFHSMQYFRFNPDVANFYGAKNYVSGILHYVLYGINEGRVPVYVLHPLVFQAEAYLSMNPDLPAHGLTTVDQAKQHWLVHGIYEGRRAASGFSSASYLGKYADLVWAFGATGYPAAIRHYLDSGIPEGRQGI